MYRAICRYHSDNPNTLSFEKNDRFTISLDDNNDKEWRLVNNEKCFTGYVPTNYLKKDEVYIYLITFYTIICYINIKNNI